MLKTNKLRLLCVPALLIAVLIPILSAEGPPRIRRSGPPPIANKLFAISDTVKIAAFDLSTVQQHHRHKIRYLSLYNIPESERPALIQTLNFMINSISRARLIKQIYPVEGSANTLVRLDITDYQFQDRDAKKTIGWNPKIWEKLASEDVYFTVEVIKTEAKLISRKILKQRKVPTGRFYSNGDQEFTLEQYYETVTEAIPQAEARVRKVAPWVDFNSIAYLIKETQSELPILRADWFLIQVSLPPFYHEFLDFGSKEQDFLEAAFINQRDIQRAQVDIKGVVVKSGAGTPNVIPVSENNRSITRSPTILGYFWRTKDVKKLVDANDFLRTLSDNKFDATELIATSRNGLQVYFLANNKGERQDEAPIEIVRDNTNADRRVRTGRSCMTCHVRGLNEFKPLPQEMVKYAIDIVSPDLDMIRILRETYISNVAEFLDGDKAIYAKAVLECNGLDTETNAAQFSKFYNRYQVLPVTPEIAQYELGMPVKDLLPILGTAKNDPFLLGLSRNEPLFSVPRSHWERSFQQAMELTMGYKRPAQEDGPPKVRK